MMDRRLLVALFAGLASGAVSPITAALAPDQPKLGTDHVAWVVQVLMRMKTIKVGMTREQLLTVFTLEGGVSNRSHRTYVSQECMYFKVDVEFRAVGPATTDEDPGDIITRMSRPYLALVTTD